LRVSHLHVNDKNMLAAIAVLLAAATRHQVDPAVGR
jgi:hypothetical protein